MHFRCLESGAIRPSPSVEPFFRLFWEILGADDLHCFVFDFEPLAPGNPDEQLRIGLLDDNKIRFVHRAPNLEFRLPPLQNDDFRELLDLAALNGYILLTLLAVN